MVLKTRISTSHISRMVVFIVVVVLVTGIVDVGGFVVSVIDALVAKYNHL